MAVMDIKIIVVDRKPTIARYVMEWLIEVLSKNIMQPVSKL